MNEQENVTPMPQPIPEISEYPDKAERKQIRRLYNKNALMFVIYYVTVFALSFILVDLPEFSPPIEALINIGLTLSLEIICIVVGLKVLKLHFGSFFKRDGFGISTGLKTWVCSQGVGYAASFISVIIIMVLSVFVSDGFELVNPVAQDSTGATIIMMFYASLGAPIIEEILCRGVLLFGLAKYNRRMAIVVSAVMFGFFHGNMHQFIYTTALGLIFAIVDLKYKSIIPSIIAHFGINTTSVILQLIMMFLGIDITATASVETITIEYIIFTLIAVGLMLLFVTLAIVVGVTHLKRAREYIPRPNKLGKTRGYPLLFSSPLVWVVIVLSIFQIAVVPLL
ncbi:MAG: CPBP family intramembrane metalloprotease [Ruminococcus sp.]|jgi:membrane protease YdiL (CAAX protease family)|nr:CPBP family intramembrane metalloprotease [Ruminococcus sp.]